MQSCFSSVYHKEAHDASCPPSLEALLCACISCNNNLTGKHIHSHGFRVPEQNNKLPAITHICGSESLNPCCTVSRSRGGPLVLSFCIRANSQQMALLWFHLGPRRHDYLCPMSVFVSQQCQSLRVQIRQKPPHLSLSQTGPPPPPSLLPFSALPFPPLCLPSRSLAHRAWPGLDVRRWSA